MKIYTLVGKSGTGKSYHAMEFCDKNNIDAIIDDGLFVYRNSVVAGVSAKRTKTKIGAVRVALFNDEEQCECVKSAIMKYKPEGILIIGTSEGMVNKIIERLGLLDFDFGKGKQKRKKKKAPSKFTRKNKGNKEENSITRINIEDITTEDEREMARIQRQTLGKHVIPAPAPQLKINFAGYFMDPLRIFRGKEMGAFSERTVVRPSYSYLGDFVVGEKVITDIVHNVADMIPGIGRVVYVGHMPLPEAYELTLIVKAKRGHSIWDGAQRLQEEVHDMVEQMTAFIVTKVDVEVRGIIK